MPSSCPFCAIAAGEAKAIVLARWRDALAIVPLEPVSIGHTLIVPRRHVRDALEDPPLTGFLFQCAADFALDQEVPGHNLITSAGSAATQTVFHLHIHVVPRREDDGLKLPWSPP